MKLRSSLWMAAGLLLGAVALALAQSFPGVPSATQVFVGGSWKTFKVNHQQFLSGGTYTPSAGLLWAVAEGCGSGGAGGGAVGASSRYVGGGGGGAGSYSRVALSPAQIGSSQVVTVPAGGTGASGADGGAGSATSLGSLLVANGGSGGQKNDNSTEFGNGGAGGTAGTGDITTGGNAGHQGSSQWSTFLLGGIPASGYYGGAPPSIVSSGNSVFSGGAAAANSCAGGGGGVSGNTASNSAGGNGGSGRLVVTEFLAQ
jgi:hypothetical protein